MNIVSPKDILLVLILITSGRETWHSQRTEGKDHRQSLSSATNIARWAVLKN